jgi:hypothetical protein
MTPHNATLSFLRRIRPGLALIVILLSSSPALGQGPTPGSDAAPGALEGFRALCHELGASVSDDEIEESLESDPCDATCLQDLGTLRRMLAAARGRPTALIIRHVILQQAYFSDRSDPSPLGKALLRTDPPSVIDVANKTVVLRSDLIGMFNLYSFGQGNGAPRQYKPSERELRELAAVLDGQLAKRGRLAVYGVFAAELWLGVQQAWPSLTAQERQAVRSYAAKGVQQPMTGAMYARILGIDRVNGDSLREQELAVLSPGSARKERMHRFMDSYIKLGGVQIIHGPKSR